MTSLKKDLNRQGLDKHKGLITDAYGIAPTAIHDISDAKYGYDLVVPISDKVPVECKTCYANTGNIAVEYVAAVGWEALEPHFGKRFRQDGKFERFGPGRKEYSVLQSIVRDVYAGHIRNSKLGLALSAPRSDFPPRHKFSYARVKQGYWLYCDSRNLVKFMKKNKTFSEGEMFITYTEEFDYNTIGALIPLNEIEEYDRQAEASDKVILIKKGIDKR